MKRAPLALASLTVCGACGGSETPAPPPRQPAPVVVEAGAPPPPPASTVSGVDPNALAQLLASAAAATMATMQPAAGSSDDADRGLREAAAKHAAGMTPDGEVAKGTLSEGGHLGFIVKMEPTKCYTIVAYGAGVEDLDLFLLVPPFYNLLSAHDVTTGPSAVIGSAPKICPISPIAVPYKIDMHARKGGGPVVAQVFSKTK